VAPGGRGGSAKQKWSGRGIGRRVAHDGMWVPLDGLEPIFARQCK